MGSSYLILLKVALTRLDRFVCKSTDLSRDEALRLIHGQALKTRPVRYLLMHKILGTICSNIDEKYYPSLFNLLDIEKASELHIAGRLDADTSGLVLISDDGRWTFNIISPSKNLNRAFNYRVKLS